MSVGVSVGAINKQVAEALGATEREVGKGWVV